ncbi:MAG: TetR/AcrR family transcriptional regulator [Acidimicrobiales bacterium]
MGCPGDGHDGDEGAERHQRADARRNRMQILEAAEVCFAEQGIGVPIDDIARRAGVGVGTVYRHFPTKESLAAAVVITHMEMLTGEANKLAQSSEPTGALFQFLGMLAREAAAKRDLFDALAGAGIDFKEISEEVRAELEAAAETLLGAAQRAGTIRPDVVVYDLFGLVMGACTMPAKETRCSQDRMMAVVRAGLVTPEGEKVLESGTLCADSISAGSISTGSVPAGSVSTGSVSR